MGSRFDEQAAEFRALRRQIEEAILPLATSVDGRRFELQASLATQPIPPTWPSGWRGADPREGIVQEGQDELHPFTPRPSLTSGHADEV